jgi:hypothetical protein
MSIAASNIDFRTSQSYALGMGQIGTVPGPVAAGQFNATAGRDLVLGRLNISTGLGNFATAGDVTAITLQGQSLMCSNQTASIRGFDPSIQMDENFIGAGLVQNGAFSVSFANLTNATQVQASVLCDPWSTETLGEVPSPDSAPSMMNFIYGMGSIAIAAGATVNLVATSLRPCVLGRLYLDAHDNAAPPGNYGSEPLVLVNQILINNTEQLAEATNLATSLSNFSLFSLSSSINLNQFVPMNGTVSINLTNTSANALVVRGHFFCNYS